METIGQKHLGFLVFFFFLPLFPEGRWSFSQVLFKGSVGISRVHLVLKVLGKSQEHNKIRRRGLLKHDSRHKPTSDFGEGTSGLCHRTHTGSLCKPGQEPVYFYFIYYLRRLRSSGS